MMKIPYEAIVIGASAGCMDALSQILPEIPAHYPIPILVVVHLPPDRDSIMGALLQEKCAVKVCEAADKEPLLPGTIYLAPPDYHLLVETDRTLSLSNEEEVQFSRPSIDVTFESAADVFENKLLGIVLTGGNNDGSKGLKAIMTGGGDGIVQAPDTAFSAIMPDYALAACPTAKSMTLEDIAAFLQDIVRA